MELEHTPTGRTLLRPEWKGKVSAHLWLTVNKQGQDERELALTPPPPPPSPFPSLLCLLPTPVTHFAADWEYILDNQGSLLGRNDLQIWGRNAVFYCCCCCCCCCCCWCYCYCCRCCCCWLLLLLLVFQTHTHGSKECCLLRLNTTCDFWGKPPFQATKER